MAGQAAELRQAEAELAGCALEMREAAERGDGPALVAAFELGRVTSARLRALRADREPPMSVEQAVAVLHVLDLDPDGLIEGLRAYTPEGDDACP